MLTAISKQSNKFQIKFNSIISQENKVKHKLLKIANELNDLIMHSKEHIKCEFSTGECKNEVKVFLFTIQIDIKITVKLLPF